MKNNCPFLVQLKYSFQDLEKLYLVMEFAQGGELYTKLKKAKKFSEDVTRFYAAEILLALDYMHNVLNVVYRDLKPDNVLLDNKGHVKLADFGLSSDTPKSLTFCGTVQYLAPEMILGEKYDRSVDL